MDNELVIKRYTEESRKLIKIIPTDIGRSIADLKSNIKHDGIVEDAREALRTLARKWRSRASKAGGI